MGGYWEFGWVVVREGYYCGNEVEWFKLGLKRSYFYILGVLVLVRVEVGLYWRGGFREVERI